MVAATIGRSRQRQQSSPPTKRAKHVHEPQTDDADSKSIGLGRVLLQGRNEGKVITLGANAIASAAARNGLKDRVNDSRTVVRSNGDVDVQGRPVAVVEISSDDNDDDDEEEDEDESEEQEEDEDEAGEDDGDESEEDHQMEEARNAGDEDSRDIEGNDRGGIAVQEAVNDVNGDDDMSMEEGEAANEDQDILMEDEEREDEAKRPTEPSLFEQRKEEVNIEAEQEQEDQPSFGELLRATAPDPIDVEASFGDATARSEALAPTQSRALAAPTGTSLGTVLTQALRTNDRELLESCLSLNDLDSIRSTIGRLPSPLVGNLLQRLAERIHRRPGRAGNLMVWVQWSLVSHGGYLASQPNIMKNLATLDRVIKERADGLQPLLRLKGKLDMLAAQLELRKSMRQQTRGRYGAKSEEEDERVIYVEGQDDDEDEADSDVPQSKKSRSKRSVKEDRSRQKKSSRVDEDLGEPESSGDEAMAVTVNGIHPSSDADELGHDVNIEDEEDEADEVDEFIDDEAEETDNDTGDEILEDDFEESPEELGAEDLSEDSLGEHDEDEDDDEVEDRKPTSKRSTVAASRRSGFVVP